MDKFAVEVRFLVSADDLAEAKDRVKLLIEHGIAIHDDDVEWDWTGAT